MQNCGIVILGNEYQALSILNMISKNRIKAVLIDKDKYGVARFSRYYKKFYISPEYSDSDYWPFLKNLCIEEKLKDWILIPTNDEQVMRLAENFEEVHDYFRYLGPGPDISNIILNKKQTYIWIKNKNILTPVTKFPDDNNIFSPDLDYPFIIKPVIKTKFSLYTKKKALKVESKSSLIKILDGLLECVPIEHIMFQEIIEGTGENQWSYAGLFIKGKPIAAYSANRLRQHPTDFGKSSTYVISNYNEEVVEKSSYILNELKYSGLAEVEWKRNITSGNLVFLEINARSWGWIGLSEITVGNIPAMLYDYLLKENIDYYNPKYGFSWMKLITDFPIAFNMILKKQLLLTDYLTQIKNTDIICDFKLNNILPFFGQFLLFPYLFLKRGF